MSEAPSTSRHSSADEDEEVFEITDFTTVSDWEKFVAQITEVVSDWQLTCIENVRPLHKNELTVGTWEQKSKEIRFSNAVFMLTLYKLRQRDAEEVYLDETDTKMEDELRMPLYMDDMMSNNNDFPPRAHCLARWYGFRSFLVLSLISSGSKTATGLTSESKCNLLLSSASIVLSESGCEVPIFIQIQQNWRKMFTGRCVGTGMQTEFEMVHLKKCPPQYQHLSGLLHVFKSKIGATVSPVQVSARFTYIMSHWGTDGMWPKENINPDEAALTFGQLLFGALDDPISDLQLSAIWPSVTEDLIIENDVHSDFNPNNAPVWTIRLHYSDNPECLLSSYLSELLKIRYCNDTTSDLISTEMKSQSSEQDIGQVLEKLSNSSNKMKHIVPELTSGISKIVATPKTFWRNRIQTSVVTTVGPISQEHVEIVMEHLFSESQKEAKDSKQDRNDFNKGEFVHEVEHQLKSAPNNSLTYRLAVSVTVANFCHGGVAAVAQLWHEFIQEMRYRFENGILISGIKTENPDLRCCLLHQKLQMLNCCIQHKIAREEHANTMMSEDANPLEDDVDVVDSLSDKTNASPGNPSEEDEIKDDNANSLCIDKDPTGENEKLLESGQDSAAVHGNTPDSPGYDSIDDDEFFECEDGDLEKDESKSPPEQEVMVTGTSLSDDSLKDDLKTGSNSQEEQSTSTIDVPQDEDIKVDSEEAEESPPHESFSAIGRLQPFSSLKLLKHNDLLYVPITQEPAPLTEDALEEQTKIFSNLGDSAEGALLRRKMQSASLLSDMESFKAANPRCCLEDFVRWYSPRDYEETGGPNGTVSGSLSDRMKIPGNLWKIMWETAKPIPARRQKRLFDDTKEGEKVLHFFSSFQPKDVVSHLLPMCFHEAIMILQRQSDASVANLSKQIFSQACKLFQSHYVEKGPQLEDLLQKILFSETMIERTMSLRHKFSKVKNSETFVRQLVENPEVMLEGAANGEVGKIVKEYFLNQNVANVEPKLNESDPLVRRRALPPPCGREYILRTIAQRPSIQSRTLPHRLYAVLMKNEFRLAGAFSSDTVFF